MLFANFNMASNGEYTADLVTYFQVIVENEYF